MLERMDEFFSRRLDGYEEHQLHAIESAVEFYPQTASCLPGEAGARVLDLGCGTGLELEYYFARNPEAVVTGIDLSEDMLAAMRAKFPGRALTAIHGSYFDVPFGAQCYDAVVSVESLHHFSREEKIPLYQKILAALKPGGFFLLTDYFAASGEQERLLRAELLRQKAAEGIRDGGLYHFDTPLTVAHEEEALRAAGFSRVEVLGKWGATHMLRACGEEKGRPAG